MTETIPVLHSIQQISKGFNAASEKATAVLHALDLELALAGIGVHVILEDVECEDSAEPGTQYRLGYGRTQNGWAICAYQYHSGGTITSSGTPLSNCSRNLRLELIKHVPKLLQVLRERAEEQSKRAEQSLLLIEELERTTQAMKASRLNHRK